MKNFLSTRHFDSRLLRTIAERAIALKRGEGTKTLDRKSMALLFFNPSLRTRLSFEAGLSRFGASAFSLDVGRESWAIETRFGVTMDADRPEHVREAAQVISRYVDAIGVRSFGALTDEADDAKDLTFNAFAENATVPVINLESAMEHPCQSVSDMATILERFPNPQGKRFILSWAPHIKPLPLAVPHSALLTAAHLGMSITINAPQPYTLNKELLRDVEQISGKPVQIEHQFLSAEDADVLYVKSWGAPAWYPDRARQEQDFLERKDWCRTTQIPKQGMLMHCLPVRRNLELGDAALDSQQSVVIEQAENRLWAQVALLEWVWRK